jgi:hypothetical protein
MDICYIIPPRREGIIGERQDGYMGDCILPRAHFCPHVLQTPEGQYFEWEDDMECGCCEPEEDSRCYVFSEITEKQFRRYVAEETKRLLKYEDERD